MGMPTKCKKYFVGHIVLKIGDFQGPVIKDSGCPEKITVPCLYMPLRINKIYTKNRLPVNTGRPKFSQHTLSKIVFKKSHMYECVKGVRCLVYYVDHFSCVDIEEV